MICKVCHKDKEDNQFQTYWHSSQQKMRTRRQCNECFYGNRMKKNNPDKYYENNPDYKKCMDCHQWKLKLEGFYIRKNGEVYLNRCKQCEVEAERQKRIEYLRENCGSDRTPPKPNVYTDEYQKACVFNVMETMGYLYDMDTGIWIKPGYKEIVDGKPVFLTIKKGKIRRDKLTKEDIVLIHEYHKQGLNPNRIANLLDKSPSTIWKRLSTYEPTFKAYKIGRD